ncbi:unnamed protein product, partial [Adineta steineri]
DEISSTDNISSVKTFDDLQILVEQHAKPISIVLFYGCYCPYSKRTIPGLRQWARINKDRIYLYEVDVKQASKLTEYYHIQTIPTIMAFENNNLLVPIWQRTANNILSSIDKYKTNGDEKDNNHIEEIVRKKIDDPNNMFIILDSSVNGKNPLLKMNGTPNNNKQEQYLIILDNNQIVLNKSNLILDEKSQNEFLKPIDSCLF